MSKSWRRSKEYRRWRISVIRRDKVCQICNSNKKRHAHHLNSASFFSEERYDVENGVTLCGKCHMNFHCNFKRSYRTKCTVYDWENFKVLTKYFKEKFKEIKEIKGSNK